MKKTKILFLILALVMVLGMLSVTAFAEDGTDQAVSDLTVEITHVSLDPAKDALGFKANVDGSLDAVTEIGFAFRVNGGVEKVYQLEKTPTDGIFTARVKNILANNGGEATLEAYAFVVVNGETVKTDWQSTSMKDTLQAVNKAWYSAGYTQVQKQVVRDLCNQYKTQVAPWDLENILGCFFGTSGDYNTGTQFDLSKDTGDHIGTVNVADNGIALGYVENFQEENFYFETKIHINGIAATENWPKFGLFVQDGTIRHHFYVDMKTDKTSKIVGLVTSTDEFYNWDTSKTNAVAGMSFANSGEYVELGLLKIGKVLHFFVDGKHVLSGESSVTGEVSTGVFGFNTSMELKEYSVDVAKENLQTLQGQLQAIYQPVTADELLEISLETLSVSVDNGVSTAISTWKAEYTQNGIKIYADVEDEISIDEQYVGMSDNVEFYIQAVDNYVKADGYALNMCCNGEGQYWLRRWKAGSDWVTESVAVDVTTENDSVYYLFEQTDKGYKVEFFISYALLNVTEAEARGNVRIHPMLRNRTNANANSYGYLDLYGSQNEYPTTWWVLDTDNQFVRNDFHDITLKAVSGEAEEMVANLAKISSDYNIYTVEKGVPAFTNSVWCMDSLPEELIGTDYVCGPKAGGETLTVVESGYVIILCSADNAAMLETLQKDNWILLNDKARCPLSITAGTDTKFQYMCHYYGKYFEAGDKINVTGEYAVAFGKAAGDKASFEWRTTPAYISFDAVDDPFYAAETNVFNACPSIAVTNGGRLIANYVTGGTAEPDYENSMVFVYSDDQGKTWHKAFVIDSWQDQIINSDKDTAVLEADMIVDPETNKLYVLYNLRTDGSGIVMNSGKWLFAVENPDAPVSEWKLTEQKEIGIKGYVRNTFTILKDGRFAIIPNGFMNSEPDHIYFSNDKGETWVEGGDVYVPQAVNFDEPVIMEESDGTLHTLFRTTKGWAYESFSYDQGKTWTVGQKSNIQNPCSRLNVTKLESGNFVMIYNNMTSGRLGMMVAISQDEGRTWENKMCLYDGYASYPAMAVSRVNGEEVIHVIFDGNRYYSSQWETNEDCTEQYYAPVYHYSFTEQDLLTGGDPNPNELELLVLGDSYTHPNWWNGFENSFGTYGAETIGIGGTKVADWNNTEKLAQVADKCPKQLLINLGINDIGAGTDGQTLGAALVEYLEALRTVLPDTVIHYNLMVYPTTTQHNWNDIDVANEIVKTYIEADTTGKLNYIDIRDRFMVNGEVDSSKLTDGLHLSGTGYAIWADAIREATGIGVRFTDLNLIVHTTKRIAYDFESVNYTALGTVGGSKATKFNTYAAVENGYLYIKAETTETLDASVTQGVDFFVRFGDQNYNNRTENTYLFEIYTSGGKMTGTDYYYPNAGKATVGTGIHKKILVQDGLTTLYGVVPLNSLNVDDTSRIAVSMNSVKGSVYDTWKHNGADINRMKPVCYWVLDGNYDTVNYTALGTVGGNKANKFNAYAAVEDGYLYFKAETTENLDASVKEGIDLFVHFGNQNYTSRTDNSYVFELHAIGGETTGGVYYYPGGSKKASTTVFSRKIVTQNGVTTLYGILPLSGVNVKDTSQISVTMHAIKGSGWDTWTYNGADMNRNKPACYWLLTYDFTDVQFASLGSIGGTKTNTFDTYLSQKDGCLIFKAETSAQVDATIDEGVDFFIHFGEQTSTVRTENTFAFNLHTRNGVTSGQEFYYPKESKKEVFTSLYREVVTQNGVTTIYGVLPMASISGIDTSKVAVSLTSVKGSAYDTWKFNNVEINRFKPLHYPVLHSDNTISMDLTNAEFEMLVAATSTYQEGKLFAENVAVISTTGSMEVLDIGDCMFSDRLTNGYVYDINFPDFMFGMDYAYNKIGSGNFTVEEAGYVIVVAPGGSTYASLRTKMETAGFEKVLSDWCKTAKLTDPINIYVKWCEAGESYSFGKWNIAVAEQ